MSLIRRTVIRRVLSDLLLFLVLILGQEESIAGEGNAPSEERYSSPRFAVYYGQTPHPDWLSRFQWAIVQDAILPPSSGQTVYFAYLSVGEADRDGPISRALRSIPGGLAGVSLGENRFWNSTVIDIRKSFVRQILLKRIERDVRVGFGGVFLDTLDSVISFQQDHPNRGQGIQRSLSDLVKTVHASYPQLRIIINRGFEVLPLVSSQISGVLYEDFCSRYDERDKKYVAVPAAEREVILPIIREARERNPSLAVLALDYDDPSHPVFLRRCRAMAKNLGFSHFDSNLSLDFTGRETK